MVDQSTLPDGDVQADPPGHGTLWVHDHAGEHYLIVLRQLHGFLKPATYLEIGCASGGSLIEAKCASLAIDPLIRVNAEKVIGTKPFCAFYNMTSDAYFRKFDPTAILGGPIDLAFLDGLHRCEFLLRDVINVERFCRRNSVVVLHDCLPTEWPMAERTNTTPAILPRRKGEWAGDVWRTALLLKRRRPDLSVTAYASPPTGLVCVTNLNPSSTALADSYADCVREMMSLSLREFGIDNLYSELNVEPTSVLLTAESVSRRFWL